MTCRAFAVTTAPAATVDSSTPYTTVVGSADAIDGHMQVAIMEPAGRAGGRQRRPSRISRHHRSGVYCLVGHPPKRDHPVVELRARARRRIRRLLGVSRHRGHSVGGAN